LGKIDNTGNGNFDKGEKSSKRTTHVYGVPTTPNLGVNLHKKTWGKQPREGRKSVTMSTTGRGITQGVRTARGAVRGPPECERRKRTSIGVLRSDKKKVLRSALRSPNKRAVSVKGTTATWGRLGGKVATALLGGIWVSWCERWWGKGVCAICQG